MIKKQSKCLSTFLLIFLFSFSCTLAWAQGEVTRSGSTWTATVSGSTVYSGTRMFEAVNAACNNAGSGATINIRNSGDSGEDGGNVYAIRPLSNQTLNFHGHTVNCNSSGDLIVAVYADRKSNITIQNMVVTGNPRYGVWFRGCSDITLTNTTMNLSNNSPVGLGIRVDHSTGSASNLVINGTTTVTGSAGHAIETYGISGVTIGDVTVSNTGGCGVLLNQSTNCNVGVVTGNYNCYGGGYATFRVANNNGSTYCAGVYSRNSGRGFFSVSGSHDCTVEWVDIANNTSHGIFLEDATNTHVLHGTVTNCNPNTQEVRTSNCSINLDGNSSGGGNGSTCGACGSGIVDGGTYRITPRHAQSMALELYNFGNSNGTNINQWTYWGGDYQHWVAEDRGSGYWSFHPVTATGRAMDVWNMSTSNGANIALYDYWGGDGQLWYFSNAGSGGWVRIYSKNSGLGMDIQGGSGSDGANLLQYQATSNAQNQMFRFESVSGSRMAQPLDNENAIAVYPNPVNTYFQLDVPEAFLGVATLKIFDINGKLIETNTINDAAAKYMTKEYQAGIYLIRIENGDFSKEIKIQHQ